MSTQFKASQQEIGRRTMLERSAVGGAALAAGFFGLGGVTEAGADSHQQVLRSR